MRHIFMMFAMILLGTTNLTAQVKTTDSLFIYNSRPINFIVGKIDISDQDSLWITGTLIPELKAQGRQSVILGRATASPDGPAAYNARLANERRASVDALLRKYGISTNNIQYDVIPEDFPLMQSLMALKQDPAYDVVNSLMKQYAGNDFQLKLALKRYDNGTLWRRLYREYFPQLRAVRIMTFNKALTRLAPMPQMIKYLAPDSTQPPIPRFDPIVLREPGIVNNSDKARRELLSIKTNLLFDFAYIPGYDRFCPIPNVAIEYYPLHGHFTYGASFDCPWWQDYDAHKYFQVRNYQIHTRYYTRSGDVRLRRPGKGAAFKGLYFSAYAHAGLYNICFDEKRGWEGEGYGGGLGIGYVVPISRNQHWRLEFGLQAGFFTTLYDPYQWLCPIDPTTDHQQYFYKWYGRSEDFEKRKYRWSWIGPTRLEITISYDILKRR